MRAIVLDRYGRPEQVMRLAELPRPVPGPGEVAVRVAAVSLNSWDVDLVIGAALIRIAAPFRPKHRVIGSDVSGTVIAVGPEVTRHSIGDTVFGELSASGWGGFAEVVTAREDALVPKPAELDDLTAAALPQAGKHGVPGTGRRGCHSRRRHARGATRADRRRRRRSRHLRDPAREARRRARDGDRACRLQARPLAKLGADAVGDEIVEPETSAASGST